MPQTTDELIEHIKRGMLDQRLLKAMDIVMFHAHKNSGLGPHVWPELIRHLKKEDYSDLEIGILFGMFGLKKPSYNKQS